MSVDELTELRTSLCRGAWQRLTDPRLDLAVLERPDVWPEIARSCTQALILDTYTGMDEREVLFTLLLWGRTIRSRNLVGAEEEIRYNPSIRYPTPESIIHYLRSGTPLTQDEALRGLAQFMVKRRPTLEREAALSVLGRWPV